MHLHTSLVVLVAPIFAFAMPWSNSASWQPFTQTTYSPGWPIAALAPQSSKVSSQSALSTRIPPHSQSVQSSKVSQHSQSAQPVKVPQVSQSTHSITASRASQTVHSTKLSQSSQPAQPTKTSDPSQKSQKPHGCLTSAEARQVGELWTQLIGNFTISLANHALTENYTDYSDAALSLNQVCPQAPVAPPLGSPVFTNRTMFEMGQGPQLPINSTILKTFQGCGSATMWYEMTNIGSGDRPVTGVIAMDVVRAPKGNPYPYMISKTYSEFDVQAWILNLKDINKCNSTTSNSTTTAGA